MVLIALYSLLEIMVNIDQQSLDLDKSLKEIIVFIDLNSLSKRLWVL